EESGGIEARFDSHGGQTTLHVESVESDGSPRDFFATTATVVGPSLSPVQVTLPQVAPGVYETSLGEIDSGAYAIRLSQIRPGSSPIARTVGLVAPSAAEYRSLGANQPFLAALRAATGGAVVDDPAAVWRHDLASTSSFSDLWPALLVLALLLWPIDIALRRVSVGSRELAGARAWLRGGWRARRAAGLRSAAVSGMLAARERAAGAGARAALLRRDDEPVIPAPVLAQPTPVPPAATEPAATSPAAASPEGAPSSPPDTQPVDTIARLREAKRRARER
ncbi:MAG TPA: hypothetical protein VEO91_11225, partial [Candidatus Limnocylindria bacterium]|nr:hypothetical protein [Candidatus Limnocylindria bacterium]